MQASDLKPRFEKIKKSVQTATPSAVLQGVGVFVKDVLGMLAAGCDHLPFTWKGKGTKKYRVFAAKGTKRPFSRASNVDLFVNDPGQFEALWKGVLTALDEGKRAGARVVKHDPAGLDRAFYTAVIAFASAIDLNFPGDKGSPGALFEIAVGAAISHLTGLDEHGQVELTIPSDAATLLVTSDADEGEEEGADEPVEPVLNEDEEEEDKAVIKTDRWFEGDPSNLIVAMKISTRERISQVSVQQLILDKIKPGGFRSILCACNENNVLGPKGMKKENRTADLCWLVDTLVPRTIALYHRFVAPFAGMYYLDPPEPYLKGEYQGLPPVKRFRDLLTADLPMLLGGPPKSDS